MRSTAAYSGTCACWRNKLRPIDPLQTLKAYQRVSLFVWHVYDSQRTGLVLVSQPKWDCAAGVWLESTPIVLSILKSEQSQHILVAKNSKSASYPIQNTGPVTTVGIAGIVVLKFDAIWDTRYLGIRAPVARDILLGLDGWWATRTAMIAIFGYHERSDKSFELINAIVNMSLGLLIRCATW
jgi:hypothetical protein